uniref:YggU family protein n=1 Tax=uncultured bacterium CSLF42 TaxID=1091574 RepID=G4WVY9_9BACT|nr:YggU family protein [uncultured bacterium CSLF42]
MTPGNRRYIKLKVQAGARENAVQVKTEDSWAVSVKEPAEDGRANRAALSLVAAHLGMPANKLRLIKGAHSPAKIVEVFDCAGR